MNKPEIRLGLPTLALFAILSLLTALAPANAADYTGTCAAYPGSFTGDGNIDIHDSACTLTTDLAANGNISVIADSITGKGINSGAGIQLRANNGSIDLTAPINSNMAGNGGNIVIIATGNVKTRDISTNGGTKSGNVEIKANTQGNGSKFVIGPSAGANGVKGTINVSSVAGGGILNNFLLSGVYIVNGDTTSSAGIRLDNMSNLLVNSTVSRSGGISLDARNGTIELPPGTLSTDGIGTGGAGVIILLADKISAPQGAIISSKQDPAASPTRHDVTISARRIEFGGTGLEIHADGNGLANNSDAVNLVPTNTIHICCLQAYI